MLSFRLVRFVMRDYSVRFVVQHVDRHRHSACRPHPRLTPKRQHSNGSDRSRDFSVRLYTLYVRGETKREKKRERTGAEKNPHPVRAVRRGPVYGCACPKQYHKISITPNTTGKGRGVDRPGSSRVCSSRVFRPC